MGRSSTIAKNTLLLYIRMLVTMSIGLFTSRVVLNTLGIEDYGIYNVVGGVVSMFSFLTTSLSTAISRFLTYSIGKNEKERLNVIFSTSINIQVAMAVAVVLIAEILGVWFLNSKLNIPAERMNAANWVIHCSIAIFFLHVVTVPYHAAIIAHERMNAFAYISIIESVLKLGVACLLYIASFDLLIIYAIMLALVQLVVFLSNWAYCRHKFKECYYHYCYDKALIKEMTGFAGWNLVGTGSSMLNTQAVNIITNIYFGVAANAARGVANQVKGLMMQFVTNFTTAINPQITKSYASGDTEYMFKLICKGAKYSYFLMLFFLVPLMFEIEWVLDLWLKNYPPLAPIFLRLMIVGQMIDFLGNSTARAVWATGKVRKYYLIISLIAPLVFPITYLLFSFGFSAEWAYWAFIFIYSILIPVRLQILKELTDFRPSMFYKEVLIPASVTTICSFLLPSGIYYITSSSVATNIGIVIASIISVIISIWFIGINREEKVFFMSKFKKSLKLNK